jgi:hypothetical protein
MLGAHEVAVKATFPLARRICAAQDGGITSMEFPVMGRRSLLQCRCRGGTDGGLRRSHRGCPGAGQIRRTAPGAAEDRLAAVARPASEVAELLLVEVLGSPRAWAAALGLARSLARWLASRRPPASAGVEVTTGRVTVVKDAGTSVLVHRVETALVVRTLGVARGWPADDQHRAGSKGQQR